MKKLEKLRKELFKPLKIEELQKIKGGERTMETCIRYTGSTDDYPCGDKETTITYDGSASDLGTKTIKSSSGHLCT